MKNKLLIVALAIPFICLLTWVLYLAFTRATGREVTVVIQGYDPRDLLSGRFVSYTIDWNETDCTQFADDHCPQNEFCQETQWEQRCRFFVDERKADDLNTLLTQQDGAHRFEVIYSYTPGKKPIAKQLLVDGQDWESIAVSGAREAG